MSKFDAVFKKIQENLPAAPQQPTSQPATQAPVNNQQEQTNLQQLASELAKINDPTKIAQMLNTLLHPEQQQGTQQKPVTPGQPAV